MASLANGSTISQLPSGAREARTCRAAPGGVSHVVEAIEEPDEVVSRPRVVRRRRHFEADPVINAGVRGGLPGPH